MICPLIICAGYVVLMVCSLIYLFSGTGV
jgi:hypothetical protein